jgi:hypothetical protein
MCDSIVSFLAFRKPEGPVRLQACCTGVTRRFAGNETALSGFYVSLHASFQVHKTKSVDDEKYEYAV